MRWRVEKEDVLGCTLSKIFVMNCYEFKILFINYIHFGNTIFLLLCSGKSEMTDRKKYFMHKYFCCNRVDSFLDMRKKLRNELVECQKTEPCRASKEAL